MDSLSQQAKESPRLRQAFDLRTSPNDSSQRILNAVEPGTILPIHRQWLYRNDYRPSRKSCATLL